MATFINVNTGGDELLTQAKQQQQAARWAQGQKMQREELANDKAKQQSADPQGKGLDPLPYRRDLAAFKRGSFPAFGFVDDGNNQIITVWSADLQASVTFDGLRKEPAPEGVYFEGGQGSSSFIDDPSGLNTPGLVVNDDGIGEDADWEESEDFYRSTQSGLGGQSIAFTGYTEDYTYSHIEQGVTFVLPAGPETFIYARLQETNSVRSHSWTEFYQISTLTHRYNEVVNGTFVAAHYAHEIQQSLTPYRQASPFRSRQVFCCVVGPRAVRKIEAPAGLKARLEYLYPPLPNPTLTLTGGFIRNVVTRTGYTNAGGFAVGTSTNIYYPDVLAVYDYSLFGDGPGYEKYADNGLVSLSLLRQFGIGNLDSTDHSGGFANTEATEYTPSRWSPAVFSLLASYDGSLDSRDDAFSYAYIRQAYLPSAPRLFFDSNLTYDPAADQFSLTFPSTRVQPATLLTRLDSSQLRANPSTTQLLAGWEAADFPQPLLVWDWANPGYCRQRLLALGFSASDFVP
jgi:hypothetical protein